MRPARLVSPQKDSQNVHYVRLFWRSLHIATIFFRPHKTNQNLILFLLFRLFHDFELQRGHNTIVCSRRCQKPNVHNHTLSGKTSRTKNNILSLRNINFSVWGCQNFEKILNLLVFLMNLSIFYGFPYSVYKEILRKSTNSRFSQNFGNLKH